MYRVLGISLPSRPPLERGGGNGGTGLLIQPPLWGRRGAAAVWPFQSLGALWGPLGAAGSLPRKTCSAASNDAGNGCHRCFLLHFHKPIVAGCSLGYGCGRLSNTGCARVPRYITLLVPVMHVEWQALPDVDSNMSAQVPAHQPVILHAPAAPPQAQRSTRVEAAAQSSSSVCETNRSRAPAPHTVPTSNSRVVHSVPEPVTVPVQTPILGERDVRTPLASPAPLSHLLNFVAIKQPRSLKNHQVGCLTSSPHDIQPLSSLQRCSPGSVSPTGRYRAARDRPLSPESGLGKPLWRQARSVL